MLKENNSKTKIWVYAIILFMSAFVVLLFTGISQIRLNENIDDYKNKLFSKDSENNEFKLNLNSALEQNAKLEKNKKVLESEISALNGSIEQLKKQVEDISLNNASIKNAYEGLMELTILYHRQEYLKCAELLKNDFNKDMFGENALTEIELIKEVSFKKAAENSYKQGSSLYKEKKYEACIASFSESLGYAENESYSDDCLYLLAYSQYKLNDIEKAKASIEDHIKKYPQSNYAKQAIKLKNMLN